MAMVKCRECKKDVSSSAKMCPHCGIESPGQTLQGKPESQGHISGWAVLGVFAALFIFIGWLVESEDPEPKNPEKTASHAEKAKPKQTAEQKKKAYLDRLNRELAAIDKYNVESFVETKDSIIIGMGVFHAWASLAEEASGKTLDPNEQEILAKFKRKVAAVQAKAFPRLRDAYGTAIRTALWEHDISAKTFGSGYKTIEFVGGAFAANKNIKEFQGGVHDILTKLRFSQARYKWYKEADEYTYYAIESHSDSTLVIWNEGGNGRIVK